MKKVFVILLLLCIAVAGFSVPAKRGVKKTLPLNGIMTEAQLMGDEVMHYWQTDDGRCLVEEDGRFVMADVSALRTAAMSRRIKSMSRRQRRVRTNSVGDFTHYYGQKRGLIILVEFSDMTFMSQNDSLLYTRLCNEENFNESLFCGSVYDYFRAQSYGQFELTFDVMGPVSMPNNYRYYGQDSGGEGYDIRPGEMVVEACRKVDGLVDFSNYDWDDDGEVDQVMIIYAGRGQADGGDRNTIWPHEWTLEESDYGGTLELDGVTINTYAVANERGATRIAGIGTICHEFSHCLGLADMYDTAGKGHYGMDVWSLMDYGSYSGNGFCPSGFSSFDKYSCGWVTPVELTKDAIIKGMEPLEDAPIVYLVRNDAYEDEYFLLENRQRKGWDAYLPASGMLILYVDFDKDIWFSNLVNTINSVPSEDLPLNDHQRCTPFRAGGKKYTGALTDPYPYMDNDSLTNTSSPAATLYHENVGGKMLMNKGILDIAQAEDGTMSFRFRNSPADIVIPDGMVLMESFSQCTGSGGNDDIWNVNIATSKFVPDNEGWDVVKAYGGYKCARFGNAAQKGRATTPAFVLGSGTGKLSFKAAGWNNDGTTLRLSVEGNGKVSPDVLEMTPFSWKEFEVKLSGSGLLRICFEPDQRFMLDEVQVLLTEGSQTAIHSIETSGRPEGFYQLDGRYAGNSAAMLKPGMYIKLVPGDCRGKLIFKK